MAITIAYRQTYATYDAYLDAKVVLLENIEGNSPGVYLDSVGIPTIGIGWNISTQGNNRVHLEAFVQGALGIAANNPEQFPYYQNLIDRLSAVLDNTYVSGGTLTTITAQEASLQNELNRILQEETGDNTRVFAFPGTQAQAQEAARNFLRANDDEHEIVLLNHLESFGVIPALNAEDESIRQSGVGVALSPERLALLSLAYNNTELIGSGLRAALQNPDPVVGRMAAWYEIRYRSNGGDSPGPGIAKRRYYEAALFGLYQNANSVSEADANALVDFMLGIDPNNPTSTRIGTILAYEQTYENDALNAISDYHLGATELEHQISYREIFKPVAATLIQRFADTGGDIGLATQFDGEVNLGLAVNGVIAPSHLGVAGQDKNDLLIGNPTATVGSNSLSGGLGNDVLIGGVGLSTDKLDGGEGNDHLWGGGGNDVLDGGNGNDAYYFLNNDGRDTILDNVGTDKLMIQTAPGVFTPLAGGVQTFSVAHPDGFWIAEDGTTYWRELMPEGDGSHYQLIVTGGPLGNGKITIKNFLLADAESRFGLSLPQEEEISLLDGLLASNPFSDPNYQPPATSTATLTEGGGSTYTLALNSVSTLDRTVTLSLNNAVGMDLITGDNVIPFTNGSVTVVVPAGQSQVVFGLRQNGDIDDTRAVTFTATLPGAAGAAGISHAMTLNIVGTDEGIAGDGQVFVLADIAAGGATSSTGNDHIIGDGRDYIDGDAGNDLIEGFLGEENLVAREMEGGEGNDLIFTDRQADEAALMAAGETAARFWPAGFPEVTGFIFRQRRDEIGGEYYYSYLNGGNGDDRLFGGNSDDHLNGEGGNDTLVGGGGNDQLLGAAGADVLFGGAGNDKLLGGRDDDALDGGAGTDLLVGGRGADMLLGGADNDTLEGDTEIFSGYSTVNPGTLYFALIPSPDFAAHGNDFLDGGAGDDTVIGHGGDDALFGGDGNDFLFGGSHINEQRWDVLTEQWVTISSAVYDQNFLSDNDSLNGEGGNDELHGGLGNDLLIGGAGNDLLFADYADSAAADQGDDTLYGGDGNDQLLGFGGADYLDGGAGIDTLVGGKGEDTLRGGEGDDELIGDIVNADGTRDTTAGDADYLDGGDGNDVIYAQGGNDEILGGLGADTVYGDLGDDLIYGGAGADVLAGSEGSDTIYGGLGDDNLHGDIGGIAIAAQNADQLYGEAGDDYLVGYGGDDWLDGGDGIDTLFGMEGNDTLAGGAGNDLLDGGADNDVLNGGDGDDSYFVGVGYGRETIVDAGGTDTLVFGPGLSVNDLQFMIGSLGIRFAGTDVEVHIAGFNPADALNSSAIEFIGFQAVEGGPITSYSAATLLADKGFTLTGDGQVAGTNLNDTITTGANADFIDAGAGNDFLDGGAGADVLLGGAGNDTYMVDNARDFVFEKPGEGVDLVRTSVNYTLTANVENLVLLGLAADGTGNELDNRIIGNDWANNLYGLAGADLLRGGAGNDFLDGGTGADRMEGGAGNDRYQVDNAGDVVVELLNAGVDGVDSTVSYFLTENVENLVLLGSDNLSGTGNALANYIVGNDGDNLLRGHDPRINENAPDILVGGAGNDTLGVQYSFFSGGDTMIGGTGDDIFYVSTGDRVVEEANEGIDTVFAQYTDDSSYRLTDNVENLVIGSGHVLYGYGNSLDNLIWGNSVSNRLYGGDGNDRLFDGSGNDTLDGGAGADYMNGGAGYDTYFVDNVGDVVEEAANHWQDSYSYYVRDIVYSSVTYTLSGGIEDLTLTGNEALNGTGNALGNAIIGNDASNVLYGYAPGEIQNPGDRDSLSGGGGDDFLYGGDGNDWLDGGSGIDYMVGGYGNDFYRVIDNVDDQVVELQNQGEDGIFSSFDYTLPDNFENLRLDHNSLALFGTGNDLSNTIYGNDLSNVLEGRGGNDTISGDSGNDHLDGGAGNDFLYGGGGDGDDTFMFGLGYGRENISGHVGYDTLAFGHGIDINNLQLQAPWWEETADPSSELYGYVEGTTDLFVINRFFDPLNGIERFRFADGTILTQADVQYALANIGPAAVADATQVFDNAALPASGNVLANDTDDRTGNVGLSIVGVASGLAQAPVGVGENLGRYGRLTLNANGTYTYLLDQNLPAVQSLTTGALLTESFIYTVSDNELLRTKTAMGTLTVTIVGTNSVPVVAGEVVMVSENSAAATFTTAQLLANDTDPDAGDVLAVSAVDANSALGFSVGFDGATVTYNAGNYFNNLREGEVVVDTFDYRVADNAGATATATVSVQIVGANDAPIAIDDQITVAANTANSISVNLLANDSDPDHDTVLTAQAATQVGTFGTLTVAATGLAVYTVNAAADNVRALAEGEVVVETFNYLVQDDGITPLTDTGAVTVQVIGVNDAPELMTPLADRQVDGGSAFLIALPTGSFRDIDNGDALTYTATLANGSVLPAWLSFDAVAGVFVGTAPGDSQLLAVVVTATDRAGLFASAGFVFDVNGAGRPGLTLIGTPCADILIGTPRDDILDGRAGTDTLIGGGGHDTYYLAADDDDDDNDDDGQDDDGDDTDDDASTTDIVVENINGGIDRVYASVSYTLAANVEGLYLTGTHDLRGTGNALDNLVVGNSGDNLLQGGAGLDILEGGAGRDVLRDSNGRSLFNGGSGNDRIVGNSANELFIGGTGNDDMTLGGGTDVLLFNRGDGRDTLDVNGGALTLNLGGGIGYESMALRRDGSDLTLLLGNNDSITFDDWYKRDTVRPQITLQVVAEAMAGFNQNGTNPLKDDSTEQFNFSAMVTAFDQQNAGRTYVDRWAMTSALTQFHLGGSDDAAIGGDLAHHYGLNGSLAGLSATGARELIGAASFGSGLQDLGTVGTATAAWEQRLS